MGLAVPLVRAASAASGAVVKLKVGDVLRSARRRFTGADVAAYAAVSDDRNPVRLDDAFARSGTAGAKFARGRLVHGMLTASLLPALIDARFFDRFRPDNVGDEAAAEVRAVSISAAGERRIVKFATKCFTYAHCEDDELEIPAILGEAMVFLPTLHLCSEAIAE